MPSTYKILGQVELDAATIGDLYTVPSATEAVISSLTICNRTSTPATFRIAIRPGGAALANQNHLAFDAPLAGNDTVILTLGLTLQATDVISVLSSNADTAFQAYGTEIS